MSQDIKYNNNSFQTTASASATILTRDIQYRGIAAKNLNIMEDTIRDGWKLVDEHYSNKTIHISGWLISDTGDNLKTLVDNVKGYLRETEKNLDIETYGGSGVYRRYVATPQNFEVQEEHWNITQVPFTCEFMCQPFNKETSTTTVDLNSGGAISGSPYNEAVVLTGNYKAKPIITITVNSETDFTVFKWDNTTNSDWLQVATAFSAADVLVINCEIETVELNGTAIDFTGVFPNFDPGTNNLTLTMTAAAFNIDVSFTYYPTYL
ncbi:MAG TPA: hypothetical protein ENI23_00010 [bacterium]|nr:hypothetical protein [bacterium]